MVESFLLAFLEGFICFGVHLAHAVPELSLLLALRTVTKEALHGLEAIQQERLEEDRSPSKSLVCTKRAFSQGVGCRELGWPVS